jgi:hypothetical protein
VKHKSWWKKIILRNCWQYRGFLNGMDVVKAGRFVGELREPLEIWEYGGGYRKKDGIYNKAEWTEKLVDEGCTFWTAEQINRSRRIGWYVSGDGFFAAAPEAADSPMPARRLYHLSEAQYRYGKYLLKKMAEDAKNAKGEKE